MDNENNGFDPSKFDLVSKSGVSSGKFFFYYHSFLAKRTFAIFLEPFFNTLRVENVVFIAVKLDNFGGIIIFLRANDTHFCVFRCCLSILSCFEVVSIGNLLFHLVGLFSLHDSTKD